MYNVNTNMYILEINSHKKETVANDLGNVLR